MTHALDEASRLREVQQEGRAPHAVLVLPQVLRVLPVKPRWISTPDRYLLDSLGRAFEPRDVDTRDGIRLVKVPDPPLVQQSYTAQRTSKRRRKTKYR